MNNALVEALDNAITLIRKGKSPEEVLEQYPQWKDELRPLLDAALAAQSLRVEIPATSTAQARSRAQFLTMAMRQPVKRPFFATFLHFKTALAAGLALIVILVIGTGFASAQSVPGDILYPVKIAREKTELFFVTDPAQHLELEMAFDNERIGEVQTLAEHSRTTDIIFSGNLVQYDGSLWQIAKVDLIIPPQLEPQARNLVNRYVEIQGILQTSGSVLVEQIQLRQIDFSGILQKVSGDEWTVSRVPIKIDNRTQILGDTPLGSFLQVKAIRHVDGSLTAIEIEGPHSDRASQPRLEPTDTATEMEEQPAQTIMPSVTMTPQMIPPDDKEIEPTTHPGSREGEPTRVGTQNVRRLSPTPVPSRVGDDDHEQKDGEGHSTPEQHPTQTPDRNHESDSDHRSGPSATPRP